MNITACCINDGPEAWGIRLYKAGCTACVLPYLETIKNYHQKEGGSI